MSGVCLLLLLCCPAVLLQQMAGCEPGALHACSQVQTSHLQLNRRLAGTPAEGLTFLLCMACKCSQGGYSQHPGVSDRAARQADLHAGAHL